MNVDPTWLDGYHVGLAVGFVVGAIVGWFATYIPTWLRKPCSSPGPPVPEQGPLVRFHLSTVHPNRYPVPPSRLQRASWPAPHAAHPA